MVDGGVCECWARADWAAGANGTTHELPGRGRSGYQGCMLDARIFQDYLTPVTCEFTFKAKSVLDTL